MADQVEELFVVLKQLLLHARFLVLLEVIQQVHKGLLIILWVSVESEIERNHVFLIRCHSVEVDDRIDDPVDAILSGKLHH